MPLAGRIARLYAVGDLVDESNVEPVFFQLSYYKLTSYFLNMRAQASNPLSKPFTKYYCSKLEVEHSKIYIVMPLNILGQSCVQDLPQGVVIKALRYYVT